MARETLPGALVISLDFELRWGVREKWPLDGGAYRRNLMGAREAIPRLLRLFEEYEVAATWATVGFLFARSRAELEEFSPDSRPTYLDPVISPYSDQVGAGEEDDPLHFAPTLIGAIQAHPRQEIGTHTFSHYFCCEPGQTAEQFKADLDAASAIAAQSNIQLRSIVLPRNQHNPAYDQVMLDAGITAYRGNPPHPMWRPGSRDEARAVTRRAGRLLDSYISLTGDGSVGWPEILQPSGLSDVRASAFLRPCGDGPAGMLERAHLRRISRSLVSAARRQRIYHLWWHPHNFGAQVDGNLAALRELLDEFSRCRERYGMRSLTMAQVDRLAREQPVAIADGLPQA